MLCRGVRLRSTGVLVRPLVRVWVGVLEGPMRVRVDVVGAPSPANQEPRGQRHDQDADRDLGRPLHRLREVAAEEDDGQTKREQRGRVTQAPEETQDAGPPQPWPSSARTRVETAVR